MMEYNSGSNTYILLLNFLFTTNNTVLCLYFDKTSFENWAKFIYLGTIRTNKDYIHKEVNTRLNSGNSWYYYAYLPT